jgi:hypothetical protein
LGQPVFLRVVDLRFKRQNLIQFDSVGIACRLSTSAIMTHKTPQLQPVLQSRMLPRITLGFLFGLTTLGALIAAVARAAGQGAELAIAALAALGFVALCFAIFVTMFLICRVIAMVKGDVVLEATEGSPFSDGQLPPQILPPRESRS